MNTSLQQPLFFWAPIDVWEVIAGYFDVTLYKNASLVSKAFRECLDHDKAWLIRLNHYFPGWTLDKGISPKERFKEISLKFCQEMGKIPTGLSARHISIKWTAEKIRQWGRCCSWNGKISPLMIALSPKVTIKIQGKDPLQMLIDHNMGIEHCDDLGRSCLHHAADAGKIAPLKQLLEKGVNPNTVDDKGETALTLTLKRPCNPEFSCDLKERVELLLQYGADPNLGGSALVIALTHLVYRFSDRREKFKVIELLLNKKASFGSQLQKTVSISSPQMFFDKVLPEDFSNPEELPHNWQEELTQILGRGGIDLTRFSFISDPQF